MLRSSAAAICLYVCKNPLGIPAAGFPNICWEINPSTSTNTSSFHILDLYTLSLFLILLVVLSTVVVLNFVVFLLPILLILSTSYVIFFGAHTLLCLPLLLLRFLVPS